MASGIGDLDVTIQPEAWNLSGYQDMHEPGQKKGTRKEELDVGILVLLYSVAHDTSVLLAFAHGVPEVGVPLDYSPVYRHVMKWYI